jgi:hypothetical protein
MHLCADHLEAHDVARFANVRELELTGSARVLPAFPALESLVLYFATDMALVPRTLKRLTLRDAVSPRTLEVLPLEYLETELARIKDARALLRALPTLHALKVNNIDFLRDDFSWRGLADVLSTKHSFRQLEIDGGVHLQLQRASDGWTAVFPVGRRTRAFYEEDAIRLAKPLRKLGVTRVILYPEEPRHSAAPFARTYPPLLAAIEQAWKPVVVEKRDAHTWPGAAVGEDRMLGRDRCCPSR